MTAEATKSAARALLGLNATAPKAVRSFVATQTPHMSEEQEMVLSLSDHRVVVTALAGAGKSRVLAEFVKRNSHRSCNYLAFNKSMALEASRLMPRATCKTLHSLAFSSFGKPYIEKCALTWNGEIVSRWCSMNSDEERLCAPLVVATMQRFLASKDTEMSPSHIPMSAWKSFQEKAQFSIEKEKVVGWAEHLWRGMVDVGSSLPMDLDGIVKLMQLAGFVPRHARTAAFLVDEAQDLTPCARQWIDQLPFQVIRAGDPHQSIYGWRMQGLSTPWIGPGEKEVWLCGSWRFGSAVADLVNPLLQYLGCAHSLVGMGMETVVSSQSGEEEVLLARTRAGLTKATVKRIRAGATIDYSLAPWMISRDFDLGTNEDVDAWDDYPEIEGDVLSQAQSLGGQKVMTAHASKGGSYRSVLLADDFSWPPNAALDNMEEARTLYVALTRAKEKLVVPEILLLSLRSLKNPAPPMSTPLEDDGF